MLLMCRVHLSFAAASLNCRWKFLLISQLVLLSYTVDPEDIPLEKVQVKSSGHVLPYVGVACLGAILFGYHLGYVLWHVN